MTKTLNILSKINYFYKLAQSETGLYNQIVQKANEARIGDYSDLAIEIALIADLYRIAVKNNSGIGIVANAVNNCIEDSLDSVDEADYFENFLNEVFADLATRAGGNAMNAPVNEETKSLMDKVKSKLNFIGTEDLLRRIKSISDGTSTADDEIEEEGPVDLGKYDENAKSELNLNEGGSKADGGNNGYTVSGVKTYKNWIDEFKNEKRRYDSMLPKASEITAKNIKDLYEINERFLKNRTELLDLKTNVSNPNQDRDKIDLSLEAPDEDLIQLRKEVKNIKSLYREKYENEQEYQAKLSKNPKIKELEMMEDFQKQISETLKNQKLNQAPLTSDTEDISQEVKDLQVKGEAIQIERNRKKNSIRVYDRQKDVENLQKELASAQNPLRRFLIQQKIELEKLFSDRSFQNKREEWRFRKQLIELLEDATSDKPKGQVLTQELLKDLLNKIHEASLKKVNTYKEEEGINKKELVDAGRLAKETRTLSTDSLKGLVKHLTEKIANGKTIAKQKVLDPIVSKAKAEIFKEEHTTYKPFLEKIASAHRSGNKKELTEAISALNKEMTKYIESQPGVATYITMSKTIYAVRDSFKELANEDVFDDEIDEVQAQRILDISKKAIETVENLRSAGFPRAPLDQALEIALLIQEQVE